MVWLQPLYKASCGPRGSRKDVHNTNSISNHKFFTCTILSSHHKSVRNGRNHCSPFPEEERDLQHSHSHTRSGAPPCKTAGLPSTQSVCPHSSTILCQRKSGLRNRRLKFHPHSQRWTQCYWFLIEGFIGCFTQLLLILPGFEMFFTIIPLTSKVGYFKLL